MATAHHVWTLVLRFLSICQSWHNANMPVPSMASRVHGQMYDVPCFVLLGGSCCNCVAWKALSAGVIGGSMLGKLPQ
eukprot:201258-Amphidinium_carterae.1